MNKEEGAKKSRRKDGREKKGGRGREGGRRGEEKEDEKGREEREEVGACTVKLEVARWW
jgi:hypothetical protein